MQTCPYPRNKSWQKPAHRTPPNPEDFTRNSPESVKSQEFWFRGLVRWKPFLALTGCPAGSTPPISTLGCPDRHPASRPPGLHWHQPCPLLGLIAHCTVWRGIRRHLLYFLSFLSPLKWTELNLMSSSGFLANLDQRRCTESFPPPPDSSLPSRSSTSTEQARGFLQSACFQ